LTVFRPGQIGHFPASNRFTLAHSPIEGPSQASLYPRLRGYSLSLDYTPLFVVSAAGVQHLVGVPPPNYSRNPLLSVSPVQVRLLHNFIFGNEIIVNIWKYNGV